jgi:hypothetical protein
MRPGLFYCRTGPVVIDELPREEYAPGCLQATGRLHLTLKGALQVHRDAF